MITQVDFEVCRVCLAPKFSAGPTRSFTSLFDENGEEAKIFQQISGVDVRMEHDVLIFRCFIKVWSLFSTGYSRRSRARRNNL